MLPEPVNRSPVESILAPVPELTPVLAREPFWGYADLAMVIGLLVAIVGFILLIAGFFAFFRPELKKDPTPLFFPTQLGLYVAIFLAFKLTFAFRYDKPVFRSLGWRMTVGGSLLAAAALGGILLAPLVGGIASLLHTPVIKLEILDQLAKHPVTLALFGVMAVTIAPLFEELLFRGFLQPLFTRSLGIPAGIGLTAVLFGSLHAFQYSFVWQYVAAVSIVGVALGIVRYKTGSIIPTTIMHGCYNGVFVAAMIFKHN